MPTRSAEAVAVAAEACADDTKGQTQHLHAGSIGKRRGPRVGAGRGTAGFVHVSCLAEQAKILVAEARRTIWTTRSGSVKCSFSEQDYHGVVSCALGGLVGRRIGAAGNGLGSTWHETWDRLSVHNATRKR